MNDNLNKLIKAKELIDSAITSYKKALEKLEKSDNN